MIRSGHDESSAIALAVGSVKRWARGGGKVSPEVRAAAGKAVAEWEKLKAEHSKSKIVFEPDVTKFNPFEHRDSHGQWTRANTAEIVSKIKELHRKGEGNDYLTERDAVRDVQSGNWHSAADHVDLLASRIPRKGSSGTKERKEVSELHDVASKLREAHVSDPLLTHRQESALGMEPDAGVLAEATAKSNEDLERDIGFVTPSDETPYDPQKAEAAKRVLMDRTIMGEYKQSIDPNHDAYSFSSSEGVDQSAVDQAYRDLHEQWKKVAGNYAEKKFSIPHFNPAELRDIHGRWSRSREEGKLQDALRGTKVKPSRAERGRAKREAGEAAGKERVAVPYRSNTGAPSAFHPESESFNLKRPRSRPTKIRANAGPDKPVPSYLRSDVHVLSTSQKYTDEQVQQLQRQLDELKSEMRSETHKDVRFDSVLKVGVVVGAIGMELLSMHTGGFGLGEGEGSALNIAAFGTMLLKDLPDLAEPLLGYVRHIREHKESIIGSTPYAKKSDDSAVIAQVAGMIASALEKAGVDDDTATRYAATVTNAAAEARDAGRREYDPGFVTDDQVQRMTSQFGMAKEN